MPEPTAEARSRWRAEIEKSLADGKFPEAMSLIHRALAQFPDHPEFLELEDQVTHARDRSVQAYQLLEEGRQFCVEGNLKEGVQALREAYALDMRNTEARAALTDNLLCYALAVLESNLSLAERLWKEANELDSSNPIVQSVAQSIAEYRQSVLTEKAQSERTTGPVQLSSTPKPALAGDASQKGSETAVKSPVPAAQMAGTSRPVGVPGLAVAPAAKAPEAGPLASSAPVSKPPLQPASMPAASPLASGPVPIPASAAVPLKPAPETATAPSPQPAGHPPVAPRPAKKARPAAAIPRWAWAAGGLAAVALCALLISLGMRRDAPSGVERIRLAIRATPPEAAVRINGQSHDISREVALFPGIYRIEASLEGYQPLVRDVEISAASRDPIELTLLPATPIPLLRISADLASGTVSIDGKPLGALENGQFAVESVEPGNHTLRIVSGRTMETVIPFAVSPDSPPVLSGPITAKELRVLVVGSHNGQGQLYSSFGPAPVLLNGQAAGQLAAASSLPLNGLAPASHELAYGAGREQRKLSLEIGPAPALFVSVNSDRNVGTLQIVSNEEGFEVRINGRPARFATQRGRHLIYNLEAKETTVEISKAGFDVEPPSQAITIRKGLITPATFKLTPTPTTATLLVRGALPGTRMSLNGTPHDLQPNGSLELTIPPGSHRIEFTRPGFKPKSRQFSAQVGQTVTLAGNDVLVNESTTGRLTLTSRVPPNARVILRQGGLEVPVTGREVEIPEGDYTLMASAEGFRDFSRAVRISNGSPAVMDVQLARIPQVVRMEGWDEPGGWKLENGWYNRKGGNFALFKPSSPAGTVQFTARHRGRQFPVFRGGRIRWVINYADASNYELYELDGQRLYWKRFAGGQPSPEKQAPHGVRIQNDTYRLVLDIGTGQGPGKIFDGTTWKPLPALAEPGAGRFGFYLPNEEEMWLIDFSFNPTE